MDSTAAVLHEPIDVADAEGADGLRLETVEVADPEGEEVLVEVGAASLCHSDVKMATGFIDLPYPMVMGHEGAGTVRAVGEAVTTVEPGDRVVLGRIICGRCAMCVSGRSNLCTQRADAGVAGTLRNGAQRFSRDGEAYHHCFGVSSFSRYTVVNEEAAVGIPDDIPIEQASLLGCGVFTGFGAVTQTADIEVGSSVAVFGAGGVGLSAVQGARVAGAAEVILVDLVAEKLPIGEAMGATHTIDASEVDAVEAITEYTDGGVDYAFDAVGGIPTIEDAYHSLAPTGPAVIIGGPPGGVQTPELELQPLVYAEKTLTGSWNGSFNTAHAIPMLAELLRAGRIDAEPMISSTQPLDELPRVLAGQEDGGGIRHVLYPGD